MSWSERFGSKLTGRHSAVPNDSAALGGRGGRTGGVTGRAAERASGISSAVNGVRPIRSRMLDYDYSLLWVTIALLGLGIVMVYSASIAMPDSAKYASYLAVPRFVIQGSAASYRKFGLDQQENRLKAGARPTPGQAWGNDPVAGELKRHGAAASASVTPGSNGAAAGSGGTSESTPENATVETIGTPPGNFPAFYASVAQTLQRGEAAPGLVRVEEALAVMAVLDLGRRSAAARAELPFDYRYDRSTQGLSMDRTRDAASATASPSMTGARTQ